MRPRSSHNERGVTLLDTLAAAVISGILLAAALPSLSTALNGNAMKASLRASSNHIRQIRSVAVSRNTQTRLLVTDNGTRLTTQFLDGGTWTNLGTPLVLTGGIRIQAISPVSGLVFNPQGTTNAATTLTLVSSSGGTKTVSVSFLGNVQES